MQKYLIIGNWKANPAHVKEAVTLAEGVEKGSKEIKNVDVAIAPPFPFLSEVSNVIKRVRLSAQDVFWKEGGPYTGEIGVEQLQGFHVEYVIVGHSERRMLLGETDEMINKKIKALLSVGIQPVLCVGERERDGNDIPPIVGTQIEHALGGVKKNMAEHIVIAYEPVWAISTTPGARPDNPDNAFRARLYIEKVLAGILGIASAKKIKILYGGSVTEKNIASYIREGHMDGALVGSASLHLEDFLSLLRSV